MCGPKISNWSALTRGNVVARNGTFLRRERDHKPEAEELIFLPFYAVSLSYRSISKLYED